LNEWCKSNDNPVGKGLCLGYITALRDYDSILKKSGIKIESCIPLEISNGKLMDIIKSWLKKHPEVWKDYSAAIGYSLSMEETFPCKE
jgi:hypothetical protein